MKLSVLNLVPLRQGQTYKDAYDAMIRLAQGVEKLGYTRYWVAEHHNTRNFGSSATALLIEHILANTESIRVGSGGVMLPNHSPYLVAEEYGTLAALYPDRVDLGLGRAPGTDRLTATAIRRTSDLNPDFENDFEELESYFDNSSHVHAYPAAGTKMPFYILGSSTHSAKFAAAAGLPYSFASHFAPGKMEEACALYRENYRPTKAYPEPYIILGVNGFGADTDEEADRIRSSSVLQTIDILSGNHRGLQPPLESTQAAWEAAVGAPEDAPHFGPVKFDPNSLHSNFRKAVNDTAGLVLSGSPDSIVKSYRELQEKVQFDELMVNSFIYDEDDQLRSYAVLMETLGNL